MKTLLGVLILLLNFISPQNCIALTNYKVDIPELHTTLTNSAGPRGPIITINPESRFRGVKSVKLFLKGSASTGEYIKTQDLSAIISEPISINISLFPSYPPCKPRLLSHFEAGLNINDIKGNFDKLIQFSSMPPNASWSFLADEDAQIVLRIIFYRHDDNFNSKQTKPSSVRIEDAYLLIEAESQYRSIGDTKMYKSYSSDSRIVFESSFWSWMRPASGFFINDAGQIWMYLSNQECRPVRTDRPEQCKDITHKCLQDRFGIVRLVGSIDKNLLVKYISLLENVFNDQLTDAGPRGPLGLDAGESAIFGYKYNVQTGIYRRVTLDNISNGNSNNKTDAKTLIVWLKEVENQIAKK